MMTTLEREEIMDLISKVITPKRERNTEGWLAGLSIICATFAAWQGIIDGTTWGQMTTAITGLYLTARTTKKIMNGKPA